jgi:hypothetical protein
MIPVDDFEAGTAFKGVRFAARPHVVHRTDDAEPWLAEFADPDGNRLALMGESPTGHA